jgi:hypothetical protein
VLTQHVLKEKAHTLRLPPTSARMGLPPRAASFTEWQEVGRASSSLLLSPMWGPAGAGGPAITGVPCSCCPASQQGVPFPGVGEVGPVGMPPCRLAVSFLLFLAAGLVQLPAACAVSAAEEALFLAAGWVSFGRMPGRGGRWPVGEGLGGCE